MHALRPGLFGLCTRRHANPGCIVVVDEWNSLRGERVVKNRAINVTDASGKGLTLMVRSEMRWVCIPSRHRRRS